ncbi:hypothetical protein CFBP4996_26345 (plasmid) [Agrobacterium leguminum]|uniref:hypothetical protein n=1 Tax=Agrobacterium leguminum TaxID=2792015 RepID=UPI0010C9F875|nr:hypothetical protein [Agrobacterium leguminum]WFS69596.1 hypothetical protein CFBP4996_26345 [Agrobacterium leguminum]
MALPISRHYSFELKSLLINTTILVVVFAVFKVLIDDTLTLGYALAVPVFIYITATIEGARVRKGGFRDIRSWIETIVAAAIAVCVGYLGYRIWLMGY